MIIEGVYDVNDKMKTINIQHTSGKRPVGLWASLGVFGFFGKT